MEKMIYLYIYAILILITIFFSIKKQKQTNLVATSLYQKIVFLTIIMIIIDASHEYLIGSSGSFNSFLLRLITVLIYAFPSLIAIIWFKYSYLLVYRKENFNNIKYYLFLLPLIINFILSIASLFWPIYFKISETNVYERGNIYFLSIILQYFYMIVPIIIVFLNQKRLRSDKFYPLIFFTIPPMIAGIIQAFNYGMLLAWPAFSFSIFLGYIFIQSKLISIDYLTGLMNKGAFENYIEEINFYNRKKEVLSITLLDLDGLKLFNDNYGHLMGDKVLSSFAECIMKSFDKNDYLARIGGDEFVIIKYVKNNIDLEDSIKRLRDCVKNLGLESNLPLSFSFSCGYGIYNPDEYSSFKELLERVDKKMYEKKALKKA